MFYEARECICFEPILEQPPKVWMDDKEDGAVAVPSCREGEDAKVKHSVVSACPEGIMDLFALVDVNLELPLLISLLIVIDQKVDFLAAKQTAFNLGPLDLV